MAELSIRTAKDFQRGRAEQQLWHEEAAKRFALALSLFFEKRRVDTPP